MSGFKNWVQTGGDGWATNACVFATEKEAFDAGTELASRWLLVTDHEARPTDEPVNYEFVDGKATRKATPPPSPSGYGCPDCGTPSDRDSEGCVCSTCHRGIVEDLSDDDELDYISGTEPGTWCEDDSLKEG